MSKLTASAVTICAAVGFVLAISPWTRSEQSTNKSTAVFSSEESEEKAAAEEKAKTERHDAQLIEAKRFKSETDKYYFLSPTPIFYCEQMHNPPLEELAERYDFSERLGWYKLPEKAIFNQYHHEYSRGLLSYNTLTQITIDLEDEHLYSVAHLTDHMAKLVNDPTTPPYKVSKEAVKKTRAYHCNHKNKVKIPTSKIYQGDSEYDRANSLLTKLKPPQRDSVAQSIIESALKRANKCIAAHDYDKAIDMLLLAEIRYRLSGQLGIFEKVKILNARCKMIESADLKNAGSSATTAVNYVNYAGSKTDEQEAKLNEAISARYKSELAQLDDLLRIVKTQSARSDLTTIRRTRLDEIYKKVSAIANFRSAMLFAYNQAKYISATDLDHLKYKTGLELQERFHELSLLVPIPEQHMLAYWSLVFDLPSLSDQDSCQ